MYLTNRNRRVILINNRISVPKVYSDRPEAIFFLILKQVFVMNKTKQHTTNIIVVAMILNEKFALKVILLKIEMSVRP